MDIAGGLLIGILVALMVTLNGVLSTYMNVYLATMIIHLVGFITIGIVLIFVKEKRNNEGKIPIYMFLGGAVGGILITINNVCFQALGVSLTLALGLFGQSILSTIVDHFGWFGMPVRQFQIKKLPGFLLIFIGILSMIVW